MSSPLHRNAIREFSLAAMLYVVLGVPAATATALCMLGAFLILAWTGSSIDVTGMGFCSGVAFVIGPLLIVAVALRAWLRMKRGEPSFLHPGLTRLVPVLIALGVAGAVGVGGWVRSEYAEMLETEADNLCFRWSEKGEFPTEAACRDASRACRRSRPIDEDPGSSKHVFEMDACMEGRRQAGRRP